MAASKLHEAHRGRTGKGARGGSVDVDRNGKPVQCDDAKAAAVAAKSHPGFLAAHKAFLLVGIATFGLAFAWYALRPASAAASRRRAGNYTATIDWMSLAGGTEEVENRIHDYFEEDTYGLAVAMLVRDMRSLALKESNPGLKYARITYAIGLVFLTLGMQITIVVCIKQFVTPGQVADIRDAYEHFESVMYDGNTCNNVNGRMRGLPGFFDATLFEDIDDDAKGSVCNIPFSQLYFLSLILIVWSITCMAAIRSCFENCMSLVFFSETKDDMVDSMTCWVAHADSLHQSDAQSEPSEKSAPSKQSETNHIPVLVITGLTLRVKAFFFTCIFLPEFLTTVYILWLGTRWLTATNDFGNLICNAVALEFVLQLKCLLFLVFASEKTKHEMAHTGLTPPWGKEGVGWGVYFSSLYWLMFAFIWVYMYIFHWQQVLPDYKWDVHQVCTPWLQGLLAKP